MLEVHPVEPVVVVCHADADRCDEIARAYPGAVRFAPDEVLVIGTASPDPALDLVARVSRDAGDEALVLDASDGWAGVRLAGPSAREAFEHLSRLELPEGGVVLGDVVRAPAVVTTVGPDVSILVPSSFGEHLRARVLERCRHLGVREVGS